MKIQMIKTIFAASGINHALEKLQAGKQYFIRESVACRLINTGKATFISLGE